MEGGREGGSTHRGPLALGVVGAAGEKMTSHQLVEFLREGPRKGGRKGEGGKVKEFDIVSKVEFFNKTIKTSSDK